MTEINICILPDKKQTSDSISLSQDISKSYPTLFTLNNSNLIPHISLYHLAIPDINIEKVQNRINQISKFTQKFQVGVSGFSNVNTYLSLNIKKFLILKKLQNTVLSQINPLRESLLRKTIEEYQDSKGMTSKKLTYIKKYGYQLIKDEFNPHITITRFSKISDAIKVSEKLTPPNHSFQIKSICIGIIGSNGTLPQIISSYELK